MPVNTPHPQYTKALDQWQRCSDCYEGGDAVKARGEQYLPRLGGQTATPTGDPYKSYKLRALFYNATGRTIDGFAGAIFQREPTATAPKLVEEHLKDVTLSGVPADMFALDVTRRVLTTGRYGVLVEMTADSKAERPYWVGYEEKDIVSWRTERRGGDQVLTRVVLRERVEEPDPKDPFVSASCEQYRVLELVDDVYTQTAYRQNEKGDWVAVIPAGATEPQVVPLRRGQAFDFIPFQFFGPTSNTPDVEKPPLVDLVDVNLSHYRTSADLEHGRHFVALPTPWIAGAVGRGAEGQSLAIGPSNVWELEKDGSAGMLEFTGQGLGALEKADEVKRRMMATLGARLLEEQPGSAETAAAVGMRHAGEHATLRTIAQTVEQGITQVLQWHAWWMGVDATPADTGASFELNHEFFSVRLTPPEFQALVMALQADAISQKTFWWNVVRGGIGRPDVTAEEEQAEIERQGDLFAPKRLTAQVTDVPPQGDVNPPATPPSPGVPPPPVKPPTPPSMKE